MLRWLTSLGLLLPSMLVALPAQAQDGGTGCTTAPNCGGCATCFSSCFCQTGDSAGCQSACSGGGGAGGAGGAGSRLGQACAASADCGPGLTCLTAGSAALGGYGPAKGLCTASCAGNTAICTNLKPDAICVNFGDTLRPADFCIEGCTFGPLSQSTFNPAKCHGRHEVACAPLFSDTGFPCTTDSQCGAGEFCAGTCLLVFPGCLPNCNSDADCGAGLYCNPTLGQCGSMPKTGKGLGEPCTPSTDGGADECRGSCTGFVTAPGSTVLNYMCAESCTNGAIPSCGWDGPLRGRADAYCLFTSSVIIDSGGPSFGDRGSCGLLCDCDRDCKNTALGCVAAPATFANATQRRGYCLLPVDETGAPLPTLRDCPDAGVGGAAGAMGAAGGAGTGSPPTDAGAGASGIDGSAVGAGGQGGSGVSCGKGTILVDGKCVAAGSPAASGDDGGCGCRTGREQDPLRTFGPLGALLAIAAAAARRRRGTGRSRG